MTCGFVSRYLCHVEVSSTDATTNIQNLLSRLQVQQVHKLLLAQKCFRLIKTWCNATFSYSLSHRGSLHDTTPKWNGSITVISIPVKMIGCIRTRFDETLPLLSSSGQNSRFVQCSSFCACIGRSNLTITLHIKQIVVFKELTGDLLLLLALWTQLSLILSSHPIVVFSYLGGAGSPCADVTSPKHLLIAQDATSGVLLVIQELLEGFESILAVQGVRGLL